MRHMGTVQWICPAGTVEDWAGWHHDGLKIINGPSGFSGSNRGDHGQWLMCAWVQEAKRSRLIVWPPIDERSHWKQSMYYT